MPPLSPQAAMDSYFMAELYDLVANELFWFRVAVEEASRTQITKLEDYVEFERSGLWDPTSDAPLLFVHVSLF